MKFHKLTQFCITVKRWVGELLEWDSLNQAATELLHPPIIHTALQLRTIYGHTMSVACSSGYADKSRGATSYVKKVKVNWAFNHDTSCTVEVRQRKRGTGREKTEKIILSFYEGDRNITFIWRNLPQPHVIENSIGQCHKPRPFNISFTRGGVKS